MNLATRLSTALVAVVFLMALPLPAGALHGPTGEDFTPNLRTERVYFHCEGATKVHNTVTDASIPWNTTAPTQSVTQGAGCGSHDNPIQGNNQVSVQDSHFEGTFAANMDAMTVELHNIYVAPARASGPLGFNVRLTIDGNPILGVNGKEVAVTPVPSATKASERVRFSIKNLNLLDEANDVEHTILMTISGGTFLANVVVFPAVRDSMNGWVYDTTEVPAGITFNPTTLEPVAISP